MNIYLSIAISVTIVTFSAVIFYSWGRKDTTTKYRKILNDIKDSMKEQGIVLRIENFVNKQKTK